MKKILALLCALLMLLPAAMAEEAPADGAAEDATVEDATVEDTDPEDMSDEEFIAWLEEMGFELEEAEDDPEDEYGREDEEDGEEEDWDTTDLTVDYGKATGPVDTPAPRDPKSRYEDWYVEETDGSEYLMFVMLDGMNDEAEEIKENGALRVAQHILDPSGAELATTYINMQETDYGIVMITRVEANGEMKGDVLYTIGGTTFCLKDGAIESEDDFCTQENYEFYIESFHFPYGSLQVLHGVRTDENGHAYYLIRSSDSMTFEFATNGLKIEQLRVYCSLGDDDELLLMSTVDYTLGPAEEIPQEILDAFGEVLEPVAAEDGEETAAESAVEEAADTESTEEAEE